MKHFIGNVKFALLVCGLLLLSACATSAIDTGGSDAEALVKERATARWEALLSGDLAGAYEYLTPGIRSSVSSLRYQRSILLQKVQWRGAEFVEAVCEETTCNVKISLDFAVMGGLPGVKSFDDEDIVKESWVRVDDAWYYVPE